MELYGIGSGIQLEASVWEYLPFILLIIFLLRFLNIFSAAEVPSVVYNEDISNDKETGFCMKDVLSKCPILYEKYNPPALFGRNGHLQTAIYGVLQHKHLKRSHDKRHRVVIVEGRDKTTVFFDVFEPIVPHPTNVDLTLAICPGICNSSEANYIKTLVHYAQEHGYRCAVLNHLGALPDIQITSSRIFSYGETSELGAMMNELILLYPKTKFISIGFSLGANLTTLYLSKLPNEILNRWVMGLSCCQSYDANRSSPMFSDWESGRRLYSFVIAENVKRLLRRTYNLAISPHTQAGTIDENRIFSASSIMAVDDAYIRPVLNYSSLKEMYKEISSIHCIEKIQIPMVFLNSADDPLFHKTLFTPVREFCAKNSKRAFIQTKFGGHLGFLESERNSCWPGSISWLDRFIVQLANAAVN